MQKIDFFQIFKWIEELDDFENEIKIEATNLQMDFVRNILKEIFEAKENFEIFEKFGKKKFTKDDNKILIDNIEEDFDYYKNRQENFFEEKFDFESFENSLDLKIGPKKLEKNKKEKNFNKINGNNSKIKVNVNNSNCNANLNGNSYDSPYDLEEKNLFNQIDLFENNTSNNKEKIGKIFLIF